MTRSEFINSHKHELAGIVLDACTHSKSGAVLSALMERSIERIEAILGRCWDVAQPPEIKPKAATPPVNGVTQGPLTQAVPPRRT